MDASSPKTSNSRSRWPYLLIVLVAIGAGLLSWSRREQLQKEKPYTVGLVTWIGYAPVYIAQEKGLFREEGLDLRVRVLDGPGAREAAYQAGEIDFFPNSPDAFAIYFANQPPVGRLVAGLDESKGADGVLARREITSIRDLRGRRVGFQSGITSHFLLLYLLKQYELSGRDIVQVDLSADEAAQAFLAGRLDAAVTWEPWLSEGRNRRDARVLATTASTPGLVVDVLLANDRALANDQRPLRAFMRAWQRGVAFLRTNETEAIQILGAKLNAQPNEVRRMLTTTQFYTPDESTRYLQDRLPMILRDAADLFYQNQVIRERPDLSRMIDPAAAYPEQ